MINLNNIIEEYSGEKIKAIKVLRKTTNLTLKESKEIIDKAFDIRRKDSNYDLNKLIEDKIVEEKQDTPINGKASGKRLSESGEIRSIWNVDNTRILRYQQEIAHLGLNEYKVITAPEIEILHKKVEVQHNKWSEKWGKLLEKERQEQYKESRKEEAIELTKLAENEFSTLENLLLDSLEKSHVVDWNELLLPKFNEPSPNEPKEPKFIPAPPKPDKTSNKFQPKIGLIAKIIPTLRNKAIKEAEKLYNNAFENWELECENIKKDNDGIQKLYLDELEKYKKNVSEWENRKKEYEKQQLEHENSINSLKQNFESMETSSVVEYFTLVLKSSDLPHYFRKEFELDYNPDTKILIIDYLLPNKNDLPNIKEIKYIISRDELKIYYQSDSFMSKLYEETVYKLILRVLYELIASNYTNAIEYISFNGWVNHINEATGKLDTICITSIQINKEEYQSVDLGRVVPKECFKNFKGISAAKLGNITPVQPILMMNRNDKRFVSSYNVTDKLDDYTNIAAISWEDFEHLIRELFEKEFTSNGGEVKVTRASRDGGVDAIAYDPDPLRGGKIVIQAKRYTNVVGVAAVRDLYGTLINEGASRGILVTTSEYGPDSYEFAKDKPLTLLTGSHLLSLLEKHGHKAKIDLKEAKILNKMNNL